MIKNNKRLDRFCKNVVTNNQLYKKKYFSKDILSTKKVVLILTTP